MKILFIIPDYGSFNNFLAEVALGLLECGEQVDVICANSKIVKSADKFPYRDLGIHFHFIDFIRGFNPLTHLRVSRNIHKVIDQINPDVISVHFTTGIFSTVLAKKPAAPTLGMFHGLSFPAMPTVIKSRIFRFLETLCFKRLDQIWMLNKSDFDIAHARYPAKTFMVASKGLGCDLEKFNINKFTADDIQNTKARLGISNEKVLMFTGRFVQFKGFHFVVKAFLDLVKNSPERKLKLLLAGGYDEAHLSGLTANEIAEMNACEHIINIGFTHETEKYLSIADLFLFPSVREGIPVCIMEALAMGIPVITADTRGCNELVFAGKNGTLLSASPDTEELKQAIVNLLAAPEKLNAYAEYSLQHRLDLARQHFVMEQVAVLQNAATNANQQRQTS